MSMNQKFWPGELAVAALQREGVTTMFGLMGGHINAVVDQAYRAGIDVFQVRHEQAAIHAADGYARTTRRPGVCFATAGPGMTNIVTGLHMSYVARTPVVALLGGHKLFEEGRGGTAQEADARSVLNSVTKWTKRATLPEQADLYIRQAFRDAMTYPYGPVAIEFPLDRFNFEPMDPADQIGYLDGPSLGAPPAVAGDPPAVQRAYELLSQAKRPLILGGDGVHWDNAGAELQTFAEMLGIPVSLRRHARGAVPESHPLVLPTGLRKAAIEQADVVLILGLNLDYFESFGDWRTDARFIQVSRHPSEIAVNIRTAVEVTADQKSFLGQLIRHAEAAEANPDTAKSWADELKNRTEAYRIQRAEETDALRDNERIHPRVFADELIKALPKDVPLVLDSFTASGYLAQYLEPAISGTVMDAGLNAAFGHGVGMAIGASVARGFKPVVSVLGDGGIGLGGGDIETAVRYKIPAIFFVYNNSALCGGLEEYAYGPNYAVLGENAGSGYNVTLDVRYDEMYATLGIHTELVTKPTEIGEALKRALDSGGPAVINVFADRNVQPGLYETTHARDMFWHLPADEVEAPARKRHHEQLYPRYHGGNELADDLTSKG